MSHVLMVDIPELDLKLPYVLTHQSSKPMGNLLGCHSGWISNIRYTLNSPGVICTRTGAAHRVYGAASWAYGLDNQTALAATDLLKKKILDEQEVDSAFQAVSKAYCSEPYTGYSVIFMSDNVNRGTDYKADIEGWHTLKEFTVNSFADWLRKKNLGVLIGAPVVGSQLHRTKADLSMNQAYIWIPPQWASTGLPGSAFISGLENLPTEEEFYSKLGKNLVVEPEILKKKLFKNKRFVSKVA